MTEIVEKKKNMFSFFKEVKVEVKKVSWPSRPEIANLTVVILFIMVIFSIGIGSIDLFLAKTVSFLMRVF